MTQLTDINGNKYRHIFPLTESIHHICRILMKRCWAARSIKPAAGLKQTLSTAKTKNQREPQKDPWAARLTDTFRQEVVAEWILMWLWRGTELASVQTAPHLPEADSRTSCELHTGISHTALPSGKTKLSVHLKWSENKFKKTTMHFCNAEIQFSATSFGISSASCACDHV